MHKAHTGTSRRPPFAELKPIDPAIRSERHPCFPLAKQYFGTHGTASTTADKGRTVSDDWKRDSSEEASQSPSATRLSPEFPKSQPERVEIIGTIATGMAHEFNNLLTVALGSLEQLRRQALDERGREQLERTEWSVRQAGRLARQVLSFVRRDAGQPQRVDLNEVIGEFDKIMSHAASGRTRLTLELCQEPLPIYLDPGQLELALLNLVRNATDAMSDNGSIIIRTAAHQSDGLDRQQTVEVAVTDTGTGMPPEIVDRVTTSFFTTKPRGQGTGLGLWMVKRFATACGGKLDIETALGRGTTVRLVFPRAHQRARRACDVTPRSQHTRE
jgi:signal transduction histidine kinase